jgi:hypothetical protein
MRAITNRGESAMKRIALLAVTATLAWGTPALGGNEYFCDCDGDGVTDENDNCIGRSNPGQDDTDGDLCGNLCDADYDQNGSPGFPDFGAFSSNFGTANPLYMHIEPISGARSVGFPDFGFFSANFGVVPGPSGTTPGTVACP